MRDSLQALESASTVSEIKSIRDTAEAVRKYAQNAKLGLHVQNKAAELKLRAERKAGRLLKSMSLHGGDRRSNSHCSRLTLADLGISQNQSRRWQLQASVPEETFHSFIETASKQGLEITSRALLRLAEASPRKRNRPTAPTESPRIRDASHRTDVIDELLDHCRLFDSIIAPLYSSNESVMLRSGERRMLRRLVREFANLLTSLQRDVEHEETSLRHHTQE